MLELKALRSPNQEEYTRIVFYKHRGFVYRERVPNQTALNANSDCSEIACGAAGELNHDRHFLFFDFARCAFKAPETAPVYLKPNEPLRLRVFIDRSVIEVFVNGKQCVAVRVYPGREDSLGISLRAQGQSARLMRLDAWQMQSIWQ